MSSRLAKPLRGTNGGLNIQIDRFGGGNERTAGFMRLFIFMGDRAALTKLTFTQDGDKLVSDKVIRDGKELPVVLQIKTTLDANAVTATADTSNKRQSMNPTFLQSRETFLDSVPDYLRIRVLGR